MSAKYEEQNQFHCCGLAPLWNGPCWEREQKGLWSVLLDHKLVLQTEELAQDSGCLSWASPRRVPVKWRYPEQGLPRAPRRHPGEDSVGRTVGQSRSGHSEAAGSGFNAPRGSPCRKAPPCCGQPLTALHGLRSVQMLYVTFAYDWSFGWPCIWLWHLFTNAHSTLMSAPLSLLLTRISWKEFSLFRPIMFCSCNEY